MRQIAASKEIIIMNTCSDCQHYHYVYFCGLVGEVIRCDEGYCKRMKRRVRKKPGETCKRFVLRETESEEALLFRKQQLSKEIGEWTEYLKKIKALGEVVIEIQDLFKTGKSDLTTKK